MKNTKTTIFTIMLAFIGLSSSFAQVGIGTKTPRVNSILDLTATDKGFLVPRLTTAQRTTLGSTLTTAADPLNKGMQVFDTDLNSIWFWNGTAWAAADSNTTYTAGTSMVLSGTEFRRAELTGDVTAPANNNTTTIANNAVNSNKIADGTIANVDLNTGVGGLYKGSGTTPASAVVVSIPTSGTIAFTPSGTQVVNQFSVDGTTLSVDALNNRVGIGNNNPTSALQVTGAATNTTATNAGSSTTIDFASSNLAYTSATGNAITLNGLKDGGAYTLIVTGSATNAVTFTASGFTPVYMGTVARTSNKIHIYSFIVAGASVYVTMATQN